MKKPFHTIQMSRNRKKATRADRPPTEGFATIVDGHFKSEFDTVEAAQAAGRKLELAYPISSGRDLRLRHEGPDLAGIFFFFF